MDFLEEKQVWYHTYYIYLSGLSKHNIFTTQRE